MIVRWMVLVIVFIYVLHGMVSGAPRPRPVEVLGGYSSVSKSVTFTRRMEFQMEKDQLLNQTTGGDKVGISNILINDTTKDSKKSPQVNHSVKFSIGADIEDGGDGEMDPPLIIPTNDMKEMKEIAENGIKTPTNVEAISSFTESQVSPSGAETATELHPSNVDEITDGPTGLLESYDDAVYEDVAPNDAGNLADKEDFPFSNDQETLPLHRKESGGIRGQENQSKIETKLDFEHSLHEDSPHNENIFTPATSSYPNEDERQDPSVVIQEVISADLIEGLNSEDRTKELTLNSTLNDKIVQEFARSAMIEESRTDSEPLNEEYTVKIEDGSEMERKMLEERRFADKETRREPHPQTLESSTVPSNINKLAESANKGELFPLDMITEYYDYDSEGVRESGAETLTTDQTPSVSMTEFYDQLTETDDSAISATETSTESEVKTTDDINGVELPSIKDERVNEDEKQSFTSSAPEYDRTETSGDNTEELTNKYEEMKADSGMTTNKPVISPTVAAVITSSTQTEPEELTENTDLQGNSEMLSPIASLVIQRDDEEEAINDNPPKLSEGLTDNLQVFLVQEQPPPLSNASISKSLSEITRENSFDYFPQYYTTDYDYLDETATQFTTTKDDLSNYDYTYSEAGYNGTTAGPDDATETIPTPSIQDNTEVHKAVLNPVAADKNKKVTPTTDETVNSDNNLDESLLVKTTSFPASAGKEVVTEPLSTGTSQDVELSFDYRGLPELTATLMVDDANEDYASNTEANDGGPGLDYAKLPEGASVEIRNLGPDYILENLSAPSNLATVAPSAAQNEDNVEFVAIGQPPSIDLSSIISNLDFSQIDFSNFDLSGLQEQGALPSNESAPALESSPQFQFDNVDLSKLASDLGIANFDFKSLPTNFNVASLDLSKLNFEKIPSLDLRNEFSATNVPFPLLSKSNGENQHFSSLHPDSEMADAWPPSRYITSTNSSNDEEELSPFFIQPFDLSQVNLNLDRVLGQPPSFSHAHAAPQEEHRNPVFQVADSQHFGKLTPETHFMVIDNFNGGNIEDKVPGNQQEPRKIIQSSLSAGTFPFASKLPSEPNFEHSTGVGNYDNLELQTQSKFPEPNTVNFVHPLHLLHTESTHRLSDPRQPGLQDGSELDAIYEDYSDGRTFGEKIPPVNQAQDSGRLISSSDIGPFTNIIKGPHFSNIDFSQVFRNVDPSNIDLTKIPANFSLGGLDIGKLVSSIDLSEIDFSKINFAELDIPKILSGLSIPSDEKTVFATQGVDEIGNYEAVQNSKGNIIERSVPPPDTTLVRKVESSTWITENETDQKVLDDLGISHFLTMANSISLDGGESSNFLMCTMCKTGVVTGRKLMTDLAKTDREILSLVIYICIEFKLLPKEVCRGIINNVGYEVMYVLRTTQHNPEVFCSMMLAGTCEDIALPSWTIDTLPRAKSRPHPTVPETQALGDFLILHISDLHTDPDYTAGSDADCDFPLCCRNSNAREKRGYRRDESAPKRPMEAFAVSVMANADDPNTDIQSISSMTKFPKYAGRWGAFGRCDLPLRSIDRILEAGADLQPDLVYITGDLPPHDVWVQTKDSVRRINALTAERIKVAFPNTPVVMTVGNHETSPINSFPVPEVYHKGFNPAWLYESLAEQWQSWVPSASMPTLLKGGYYTVTPYPGLRVLSINSNYCNSMNWWLMIAHKDPTEQLVWMDRQLAEAEAAGEKVHIITHIPPGYPECLPSWSRQFARIVTKYADIVTGIFSGHQHLDQWEVLYDPDDVTRPTSVAYIAPSATTFREHSPSFRTYSVDGGLGNLSSWAVVDHHTYTANLTVANSPGNILEFDLRYSAKQAFNMSDLSPQSWSDVVHIMATDQQLFNTHTRFKHNYWAEPTEVNDCDLECKRKSLCFLVTGDSSNKEPCERLKKIIT